MPQFAWTIQWTPSRHFTTGANTHFYRHVHALVCLKQIWEPDSFFPRFVLYSSLSVSQSITGKEKNKKTTKTQ